MLGVVSGQVGVMVGLACRDDVASVWVLRCDGVVVDWRRVEGGPTCSEAARMGVRCGMRFLHVLERQGMKQKKTKSTYLDALGRCLVRRRWSRVCDHRGCRPRVVVVAGVGLVGVVGVQCRRHCPCCVVAAIVVGGGVLHAALVVVGSCVPCLSGHDGDCRRRVGVVAGLVCRDGMASGRDFHVAGWWW